MSNATKVKQLQGTTIGSVLFIGTGGQVTEDNNGLFWDSINNRLGIGTGAPVFDLDIASAIDVQSRFARSGGATLQTAVQSTRAYIGTSSAHNFELIAGNSVALSIDAVTRNIGIGAVPLSSSKVYMSSSTPYGLIVQNTNSGGIGAQITTNSSGSGATQGLQIIASGTGLINTGIFISASGASAGNRAIITSAGSSVFNEGGGDYDFRVEGDTDPNLLFIDASADSVAIGSTPVSNSKLSINTTNSTQLWALRVENATYSGTFAHGIDSTAYSTLSQYNTGVQGNAFGGTVENWGVRGVASSSTTINKGILGEVNQPNAANNYAGYFTTQNTGAGSAYGVYVDTTAGASRFGIVVNRGTSIFNEAGDDYDFRVEGDTDPNLLTVDAGFDSVFIGTASTAGKLGVFSAAKTPAIYSQCSVAGSDSVGIQAQAVGIGTSNNTGLVANAQGVTSGRNTGIQTSAQGSTTSNYAVSAGTFVLTVPGGNNDITYLGHSGNSATSATNTKTAYFINAQTNTAGKYGLDIALTGDQASGTGYGIRVNNNSTFTSGTSYGISVGQFGASTTKTGIRIDTTGTGGTTNYGLFVTSENATTNNYGVYVDRGTNVFNASLGNWDFQVKGDVDANLLYIDASTDSIGIGTNVPNTKLDINGSFATRRANGAAIVANTNDYAIPNFSFIRLTSLGAFNITGFANGVDGRIITLVNTSASTITLTHQDALSAAGNRLINKGGASILLALDEVAQFIYDAVTLRWRHIGGTV